MNKMLNMYSINTRTPSQREARRARAVAIAALLLGVMVAVALVVAGCPDDSGDAVTAKYTCANGTAKTGTPAGGTNMVGVSAVMTALSSGKECCLRICD